MSIYLNRFNYPSLSLRNRHSTLLLFYYCLPINMDASDFTGTTARNFDRGCQQCLPKMMPCQSTPASTIEPRHFDSSTVGLGRPRVAEEDDKPDGNQRKDGSPLETHVSSCESFGPKPFSNTTNDGRKPAKKTTDMEYTSSQPTMVRPQHQHHTNIKLLAYGHPCVPTYHTTVTSPLEVPNRGQLKAMQCFDG